MTRSLRRPDGGRIETSLKRIEKHLGTVPSVEEASRRLWRAIDGRGAFRMFKDTLYDYPKLRERWFEFEAERKREWARERLEELGIEPDAEPEKGNAPSG